MSMQPRLPRHPDDWVVANCENLRELARAYAPSLVFAKQEKFFPVLAESYLSHTGYGAWPTESDASTADALQHLVPLDDGHKGTALVDVTREDDFPHVQRIGGAPNRRGRPLQFSAISQDPDAIGREDRSGAGGVGKHLIFGGWKDPAQRNAGNIRYLRSMFSEFAAVMNPEAQWDDPPRDNLGTFWVPQPATPTVYAEIEWTGRFPALDNAAGLGDFAPGPDGQNNQRLDGYLQVTYYYLFPARCPVHETEEEQDDLAKGLSMEGQWQAATVFFRAKAGGSNAEGRPERITFQEPPIAAVLSHQIDDDDLQARTEAWDKVELFPLSINGGAKQTGSTSMIVYVGQGTHAFFFKPSFGAAPFGESATGDAAGSGSADIGTEEFGFKKSVGGFLLALLIVLLLIGLLLSLLWLVSGLALALAIILSIILIFVLLIVIVMSIAWLSSWFRSAGRDPHQRQPNEEATGDGRVAAPGPTNTDGSAGPSNTSSEGSGGHDDPSRSGSDVDSGAYVSGSGGAHGHNTASFDVRVIDRLNIHGNTDFPPKPEDCERPAWWNYSGTWGVPVIGSEAEGWCNSWPRIDQYGRSWAYYHAMELERYLSTV